jgi:hypothetical protein
MTTSEILRAAKALLTPETWVNRCPDFGDVDHYCALSAIGASGGSATNHPAILLITRVATGKADGYVGEWNDAPGRTLADVHAAFDAAIAIAEQREGVITSELEYAEA